MVGWDPDGPGPLPEQIIAAHGLHSSSSPRTPAYIASRWTGDRWTTMGPPLALYADGAWGMVNWRGDVYAFGELKQVGPTQLNNIARWDGEQWTATSFLVGTVPEFQPNTALPFGDDLIIGGRINFGDPFKGIARWDGAQWHTLGAGFQGIDVTALGQYQGDLIAGGYYTSADGQPANSLARWDGQAWTSLGLGMGSRIITAIAEFQGELYITGERIYIDGQDAHGIARWDGQTWRTLGSGLTISGSSGVVSPALAMLPYQGKLIVAGSFSRAGGVTAYNVAAWDGTTWTPMSLNDDYVSGLRIINGELVASGSFSSTDGSGGGVSRWDGTRWRPLSRGFSGGSINLSTVFNGELIVAGSFNLVDETQVSNRAVWNGSTWRKWEALTTASAFGLYQDQLAVTGGLLQPGGELRVSLWDGAALTPLPGKLNFNASALASHGGDLIVGGAFTRIGIEDFAHIARWNGSAWGPMGAGMNGNVAALLSTPAGLIAGGSFTTADGLDARNIAKWDGAHWTSMGPGLDGTVWAVTLYHDEIIAAGSFTTSGGQPASRIARWDGSAWRPLGDGLDGKVYSMIIRGDELVVAGDFDHAGDVPARNLAAWNGTSWREVAGGTDGPVGTLSAYHGRLIAGGSFSTVGDDLPSKLFAQLETCPSACPADLDRDGVVDFTDYLAFLNAFDAQEPAADLDGDGIVDFSDYLLFLTAYDSGC